MMTITRFALLALGAFLVLTVAVSVLALKDTQRRMAALQSERALAATRSGQLEYMRWGEGAPVLVIHGAGGGFDQGRLLADAFGGAKSAFIAVSRFGYLGSDLPEDASTKAQAEAFADLLDALDIERVSILAISGGAPPALKFAELYPDRTRRMALLSPAPITPFSPDVQDRPLPTWLYSALLGNDVIYWCLTKAARRQLAAAFDAPADLLKAASADEKAFVDALIDTFSPASRRLKGVNNEGAAVDPGARYDLERIEAEVLVVHARDDGLNPFAVGEEIAAGIPAARFMPLDEGGHLLLGRHAELREEIERFLGD